MASYHGPKARVQRRFGEVLVPRPKYQRIMEKRGYPPGDHGKDKTFRSGRRSDYGLQLNEKQKLAYIYNIRESQMRRYFMRARRQSGNTGENMLRLLERRLDNLVYRAGFAATIWAARQLVKHGHVNVDGARVDLPSFQANPGMVISVAERMRKNVHVVESMESQVYNLSYLSVDKASASATFTALPERAEIPTPVTEQLVVEFYNRLA
ncbi:MAG: 30S ribosomal protein S4 [Pleurocapsa minor GSE-CHR-MK-17-07R]|jgi:small subunit ribosomal protein S4|nr:30S ribosomal protein S4 [Pleurocapsa minor GSE-CHR-MK 17-07R]